MRLSVCITTRNRPQRLENCLRAIWDSSVKPHSVIVSDDSAENEVQQKNRQVVEKYPTTTYLTGPRSGVCANRNNAVNAVIDTDLVAFVDDDICVDPDFIACAVERYNQMDQKHSSSSILSGVSRDGHGHEMVASKLSFRGYFCPADIPQAVVIHAAVFPRSFFEQEQWDENIFFGYEDAELCLRALKRGYRILHCPELKVLNTAFKKGTLVVPSVGSLTDYNIHIDAARLYVGIKRYKDLFPNPFKLVAFLAIYFTHMNIYLSRKHALLAWPQIIQRSHIQQLLPRSSSDATARKLESADDKSL